MRNVRLLSKLRVVLAGLALLLAIGLPPGAILARVLPPEYAGRYDQLYWGLWLMKFFLGLNAVLWLAWPKTRLFLSTLVFPSDGLENRPAQKPMGQGEWGLLAALTLLALGLRLWGLDASLSYDEIYFATSMVRKTPLHIYALSSPVNQPFTCWLAWASTHLFGFSEATMRLSALVFGTACVPAAYVFARRWLGPAVAIGTAVLMTGSIYSISYSQDAKGYTATAFFALLTTWAFFQARSWGRRRDWILYAIATVLLGYAHILALWVVMGHVLIAVFPPDGRKLLRALALSLTYAGAALGLLFAAGIPLALWSVTHFQEKHWDTVLLARDVSRSFAGPFSSAWWAYALMAIAFLGAIRLVRVNPPLLAAIVVPVAVGLILNLTLMPYTYVRYFSFALPMYYLLASLGGMTLAGWAGEFANRLGSSKAQVRPCTLLTALLLLGLWGWLTADNLRAYHAKERSPFRSVAAYVHENCKDRSIVTAGLGADKLAFYAPDVPHLSTIAALADAVRHEPPQYVVTFCPRTYRIQSAGLEHDPLAGFELVYENICLPSEDDNPVDGFVWKSGEGDAAVSPR
jgi:hypothetical protein